MSPLFKIDQIPGKGNGLVATLHIQRGTKVLSERPLISLLGAPDQPFTDENIEKLARCGGVSDQDWQTFQNFYTRFEPGEIGDLCGRFLSGSLSSRYMDSSTKGMVFLNISRITHGCSPNCVYSFNHKTQEGKVCAVKNIEEGEEITICYAAGRNVPFEHRRAQLKFERGFECLCDLCNKSGAQLEKSEARLKRIDELFVLTEQSFQFPGLEKRRMKCLRSILLRLQYLSEEGICDDRQAQCFRDGYELMTRLGHTTRANQFWKLYLQAQADCFGQDSEEYVQATELHRCSYAEG